MVIELKSVKREHSFSAWVGMDGMVLCLSLALFDIVLGQRRFEDVIPVCAFLHFHAVLPVV